ncbi:hypothetical protein KAR91_10020 [Candidatus Pacearchaeota archaeon]|nr:hypothetical protein [Candidatus Pacearchaeota archaeon]
MSKINKAFEYLKKVRVATSLQISHEAQTISPGSMMADLRKRGCDIRGKFLETSPSGAAIWQYEMLSWPV